MSGSLLSRRSIALALVIALGAGTVACKKPGDADTAGAVDTAKIAEEAMIYGFPLVMNYGAMYDLSLNPKSSQFKAPPNVLANESRVFTSADTAVVTPNSDTPYSMLQLDLRAEPMVICVPAVPKERYYSVQLIDMTSFNYGYIGSRTTGSDAGCYMVAGPNWKGETPKGIKAVFNNETQFGLTIFRTQLFNAADIDNVKKIQAGYKAQPLSAFLGQPAPAAAPAVDWPAIDKDKAKSEFFRQLKITLKEHIRGDVKVNQAWLAQFKQFKECKVTSLDQVAHLFKFNELQVRLEKRTCNFKQLLSTKMNPQGSF